ncbi:MAG: iron-sulfur cluster loop [Staphylothermus sp.]|nr:iron-sulfur cluster loop [Staphylothermus sp.]
MEVIGIDVRVIERIARIMDKLSNKLMELDVYDKRFYPPSSDPAENVLRYFLVMVAIDHRLSRPGKKYYACINNECYSGADLLYRLGMIKYEEEPEFFSPSRLSTLTVDEVKSWLSIGGAEPPDLLIRTYLLRDIGIKLLKLYNGRVTNIIKQSNERLHGTIEKPGLFDHLRVFRAYEDPVEKKPILLAKFLIARQLFKPKDFLDVPVDNHLTRIAYRLGLVMVSGRLWDKIRGCVEVSREEDILLRMIIRRAYRMLAEKSRLDPGKIDDHFWLMGKKICLRDEPPRCNECLFKQVCLARKNNNFMVSEHKYYNTWYY